MEESESSFDMLLLIGVLALFLAIGLPLLIPFMKGDVGGFDVQIEKTAPVTRSMLSANVDPEARQYDSGDALLMLVVADENAPKPGKVRFDRNGTQLEITLDEAFFSNRKQSLETLWTGIPSHAKVDVRLYAGPEGMRYWNFGFAP
ncbi:hypothetical protein [Cohnella panacarvi]|uniref:hypothetical protein n=1 Tax=Cohnella panacarvi TaxID=400776 RepID=UPI00047E4190|nr:hypothetical protein [Cohnella panacarvi]